MVLGIQWLRTLDPIQRDSLKLHMTFNLDGVIVTLQGLSSSENKVIQSKEWEKATRKQEGVLLQPTPITNSKVPYLPIPPQVQTLINQYCDIVAKSNGLPPRRDQDH